MNAPPAWPASELPRALTELADRLGLRARVGVASDATLGVGQAGFRASMAPGDPRDVERWIGDAAEWLGLEAVAVGSPAELRAALDRVPPAIVRVEGGLAVLVDGRTALSPDGRAVPYSRAGLAGALRDPAGARARALVARVAREAGLSDVAQARAIASLLGRGVGGSDATDPGPAGWLIRPSIDAPIAVHARSSGLDRLAAELVGLHVAQLAVMLGGWALIGRASLAGRFDPGIVSGWAVLLLSLPPLRLRELDVGARLAAGIGLLVKRRALRGALALDPSVVRREGAGGLLGRVHEAEAVEAAGARGGVVGLFALLDLVAAAWVLGHGAGGLAHAGLLGAWILGVAGLAVAMVRARAAWAARRLDATHVLAEQMAGHRTRLVQASPDHRHDGDDDLLADAWARASALDRRVVRLRAAAPQGFLLASIVWIGPAVIRGASPSELALALGGALLARASLSALVDGLCAVSEAVVAWRQLGVMLAPGPRPDGPPHGPVPSEGAVIEARDVAFRHPGRSRPALVGCALRIDPGDRVLIEGPSGGGKSTLVSLLAGLRRPDSGLLLLRGLDLRTLGASAWRRLAVAAPQFHDNHVLTGPFAFNLLMGRGWPPTAADLALAAEVCAELGLGELLARMPGGMWQIVGETGWQLSHGEQSRLFLARALVQGAELVVLDETFAALDPDNLARALATARARAPALVVVAHP